MDKTTAKDTNEEHTIDLGDAADLTLGEGKSQKEDKRKLYN